MPREEVERNGGGAERETLQDEQRARLLVQGVERQEQEEDRREMPAEVAHLRYQIGPRHFEAHGKERAARRVPEALFEQRQIEERMPGAIGSDRERRIGDRVQRDGDDERKRAEPLDRSATLTVTT